VSGGGRGRALRLSRFRRGLTSVRLSPARLDADAALALVGDGAVLIDVRQHDDPSGFLAGAERVPPSEIPERLAELPRDRPIVLACT
jgi:rhodanese-related sulfurtransferase